MATLDDVLILVTIAAGLIFVPWVFVIRPWLRRRQAASVDRAPVIDLAGRGHRWSLRGELARLFLVEERPQVMSSDRPRDIASAASAGQVWHQVSEPVSVSAEPNTADTEQVSGATGASAPDTSARDIMRASVIAELLDSGLLTNRDKAIMQIFHCSKASSSRPDAPFQVALRLVEQHRAKKRPEYVGDMIARVEREVAEQH